MAGSVSWGLVRTPGSDWAPCEVALICSCGSRGALSLRDEPRVWFRVQHTHRLVRHGEEPDSGAELLPGVGCGQRLPGRRPRGD